MHAGQVVAELTFRENDEALYLLDTLFHIKDLLKEGIAAALTFSRQFKCFTVKGIAHAADSVAEKATLLEYQEVHLALMMDSVSIYERHFIF